MKTGRYRGRKEGLSRSYEVEDAAPLMVDSMCVAVEDTSCVKAEEEDKSMDEEVKVGIETPDARQEADEEAVQLKVEERSNVAVAEVVKLVAKEEEVCLKGGTIKGRKEGNSSES